MSCIRPQTPATQCHVPPTHTCNIEHTRLNCDVKYEGQRHHLAARHRVSVHDCYNCHGGGVDLVARGDAVVAHLQAREQLKQLRGSDFDTLELVQHIYYVQTLLLHLRCG